MPKPRFFTAVTVLLAAIPALAQGVDVTGLVKNPGGAAIAGATVTLLESGATANANGAGVFHLQGSVGVFRPKLKTPQGLRIVAQGFSLRLENPGEIPAEISWLRGDGTRESGLRLSPHSAQVWDLRDRAFGFHVLVVSAGAERIAYPVFGYRGSLHALSSTASVPKAAARVALDTNARMTLEFRATGFLTQRFRLPQPVYPDTLRVTLLPATATLKERIQHFIGDSLNLRMAWLNVPAGQSRYQVYHGDLGEMAQDTFPLHTFANSLGAVLPSWSPDGNFLAYETGREAATLNAGGFVSRIFLQTLAGTRANGPGFPATNPRFWANAVDTLLVWCSSGNDFGWVDTSATYAQRFSGGALTGSPRKIASGSYNAGLSADSNWLAGGSPRGVLLNRSAGLRTFVHVYPASPLPLADSVQVCNVSMSPDPNAPSQAMFIDFGVFDAPGYPNIVTPKRYGQHQIILIADGASTAPGRIVDFIDTPAGELGQDKSWDDPEWSNHPDFAVASTRGLDGQGNPVQPDLYLVKISTRESIKLASGAGFYMPVAWLGRK